MKTLIQFGLFTLLLFCVMPLWAESFDPCHLVDLGGNKFVVGDATVSSDGHYAIAWTILKKDKDSKLVDWSTWSADDPFKFLDAYIDTGDPSNGDDYTLIDCVVDLKNKSFITLPTDEPYFSHKNHGFLTMVWGPAGKERRYAVVDNDGRYNTANFWVITIDSKGMHQKDIGPDLDKIVAPILEEKRPLRASECETLYSIESTDDKKIQVFQDKDLAKFAFYSDIPKSPDDSTAVQGDITVRLADEAILKAVSDTKRDDPFRDVPQLAKADQQLNQVYAQLQKKLAPADRELLKKDQLDWINKRNSDCRDAVENQGTGDAAADLKIRNTSLLESTQARVDELKQRLEKAK